jgi:hypothetical protein
MYLYLNMNMSSMKPFTNTCTAPLWLLICYCFAETMSWQTINGDFTEEVCVCSLLKMCDFFAKPPLQLQVHPNSLHNWVWVWVALATSLSDTLWP